MFESEAHTERGSPSLVGRGIANPQEEGRSSESQDPLGMRFTLQHNNINSFEDYLKTQNKRNIRQICCYTARYHHILETGDASELVKLQSGSSIRRHAMEALTAYSKHLGCYDRWQQIRKRYSLHWTDGNESLHAMQRFFDPNLSLDSMLQRIKEMIACTPTPMSNIIKFACLVGLRPSEVVESVRLLSLAASNSSLRGIDYYNPERQALEHFRFPQFLRKTKKAYISFVTPDMLEPVASKNLESITYNAIRSTCQRKGIKMDMRYCRKIHASWLHQYGKVSAEEVDFLQGRTSPSLFSRHYLSPSNDLKDRVLDSLDRLSSKL